MRATEGERVKYPGRPRFENTSSEAMTRSLIIEHQLWNIVLRCRRTSDLVYDNGNTFNSKSNGEDKPGLSRRSGRSEARQWARSTRDRHGIRTKDKSDKL